MQSLTISSVDDSASWHEALALRNALQIDNPMSYEEALEHIEFTPPGKRWVRELFREGERAVIYASIFDAYWLAPGSGMQFFVYTADGRADLFRIGLERMHSLARGLDGFPLTTWVKSNQTEWNELLLAAGYEEVQRNPVSALDLTTFEPQVATSSIEVVSYAAWRERRPDQWIQDLYDLEMAIWRDVPMTGEPAVIEFDHFEKELFSKAVDLELCFLAIVGDKPVGLSQILLTPAKPELGRTGLTGVLRECRRQGLARAMKNVAMATAKQRGMKRLITDNEKNNPMLDLNVELGFRSAYDQVGYKAHRA